MYEANSGFYKLKETLVIIFVVLGILEGFFYLEINWIITKFLLILFFRISLKLFDVNIGMETFFGEQIIHKKNIVF